MKKRTSDKKPPSSKTERGSRERAGHEGREGREDRESGGGGGRGGFEFRDRSGKLHTIAGGSRRPEEKRGPDRRVADRRAPDERRETEPKKFKEPEAPTSRPRDFFGSEERVFPPKKARPEKPEAIPP